jgi:Methyltransferase FkbM domain
MNVLKRMLPDRTIPLPILRGPFRGGTFVANPRNSLRKIVGLYEAELNPWLTLALSETTQFIDVGANDGYFLAGCIAAMRRQGRKVKGIACEPDPASVANLRRLLNGAGISGPDVTIVEKFAGRVDDQGTATLDSFADRLSPTERTLIKIDVEGAEVDVLLGAKTWMVPSSIFVVEVHSEDLLTSVSKLFADSGLDTVLKPLGRLPIIGAEQRERGVGWLVSSLAPTFARGGAA